MNVADRLIDQSRDAKGCRVWTGSRLRAGYGRLTIDGRTHLAHRVSYETFVAPIPAGLTIDHLCLNKACILPAHLEVVTVQENIRRANVLPCRGRLMAVAKNHPEIERSDAERERIAETKALLSNRSISRADIAAALAAQGRTVAVETISLWRHGRTCPNDANMAALRSLFPAAALDALVAPDRWSTTNLGAAS